MKNDDLNENKNSGGKIPLNKKTLKFVLIVVTFTLVLSWCLNHSDAFQGVISDILGLFSPFFAGACIAFIINTVLRPIENLWDKVPKKFRTKHFDKAKRPVCLTFSILVVLGTVFAILFMIIPQFIETVTSFANKLPQYISNLSGLVDKLRAFLARHNFVLPSFDFNWSKVGNYVTKFVSNYSETFINATVEITTTIVTSIVNFVIAIFFSIYILAKKERLGKS